MIDHSHKHKKLELINWGDWILLIPIALILLFTSWTESSIRSPLQNLLVPLTFLSLFSLLISSYSRKQLKGPFIFRPIPMIGKILKDPVFYLSFAFLILLVIQWLNSPRNFVFSPPYAKWILSPPPHAAWPSAVNTMEAREMINWFFPVLSMVLCIRRGFLSRKAGNILLTFIILNAMIMGFYGLWRFTQVVYDPDIEHIPKFFGMFGYQNHAGIYFVLMMSLSAGRLVSVAYNDCVNNRKREIIVYLFASILFFICAIASVSRASIILAFFVLLITLIRCFKVIRNELLTPSRIFNVFIVFIALSCITFFLAAGSNPRGLFKELKSITPEKILNELHAEGRSYQRDTAISIWKDHKCWGIGGWGYRHMISFYMDRKDFKLLQPGAANLHCDPLQFLIEFGLLGFGLLVGIVLFLWVPILYRLSLNQHEYFFSVIGLSAMFFASFIDLPFRNPLLLQHWILISVILASDSWARPYNENIKL